jgi:hypothetical protein
MVAWWSCLHEKAEPRGLVVVSSLEFAWACDWPDDFSSMADICVVCEG